MINLLRQEMGWIEVICGPMFSGKSEELIRRLRRAEIAKLKTAIFKPDIDNRFSVNHIVSHSDQRMKSVPISTAREILNRVKEAKVIGIDEAQFFDASLVDVCQQLADEGKRVIVAGLDQDYTGAPFEPIPQLLAVAEVITKTLAICVKCGNPADRTQRLTRESERVIVGASNIYQARCRLCHTVPKDVDEKKAVKR